MAPLLLGCRNKRASLSGVPTRHARRRGQTAQLAPAPRLAHSVPPSCPPVSPPASPPRYRARPSSRRPAQSCTAPVAHPAKPRPAAPRSRRRRRRHGAAAPAGSELSPQAGQRTRRGGEPVSGQSYRQTNYRRARWKRGLPPYDPMRQRDWHRANARRDPGPRLIPKRPQAGQ